MGVSVNIESRRVGRYIPAVADGKCNHIRRVAECVAYLESRGRLASDAVRIDRIDKSNPIVVRKFARNGESSIKVAIEHYDGGSGNYSLRKLTASHLSSGKQHNGMNSGSRRIRRRACGSVSSRRADDRVRAVFDRFRNGYNHSAILE
jgi:hypothetical protein